MIRTPEEKEKADLQYREYQRESRKLLDFCERMMGKREKEALYRIRTARGSSKGKSNLKRKVE